MYDKFRLSNTLMLTQSHSNGDANTHAWCKKTHRVLKKCHFVIHDPKFIKVHKCIPSYILVRPNENKITATKIDWTMLFLAWASPKQKIGIVRLSFRLTFNVSLFSAVMIVGHFLTRDMLVWIPWSQISCHASPCIISLHIYYILWYSATYSCFLK